MKLLHIIASPRGQRSRTLKISNAFIDTLQHKNSDMLVETLDLYNTNLPEVHGENIDAKYALMGGMELDANTMSSWESIAQYARHFLDFDLYVVTNPMWNFSVPYKLKHYIDVIMQAGFLFKFTPNGVEGLALNKKMVCITSRGSDYSEGSFMNSYDFQEPYLKAIFGHAGITNIQFINAQPMDYDPTIGEKVLESTIEAARVMAESMMVTS